MKNNTYMFRDLRADEIDVRIGESKKTYFTLLLYKDARVDMDILDETVGAMNWQRRHNRDNANCEIGIYDSDKKEWIWKEDTGTESNTEAEKGLASDSFKRAGVNWGIGRELYTAPRMKIWAEMKEYKTDKFIPQFLSNFYVSDIEIINKKITKLQIKAYHSDKENEVTVYRYGISEKPLNQSETPKKDKNSDLPFPEVKSTPRDKIISTILGGNKDYIERLRTKMTELYARRNFEELNDLQFKKITELATEFANKKGL